MVSRLYIGNLPWEVTEERLREYFEQAGVVVSTAVVLNRDTGRSRGFGFVEMETPEEAERAIKDLDGTLLMDRKIIVREAEPEKPRGSSIDRKTLIEINDFVKNGLPEEALIFIAGDKHFTLVRD